MVDAVKNFLTSSLITMQNLVVSHTVCERAGGLKNFEYVGALPLEMG